MEANDLLTVGCELVEQGLAYRRGLLRIMMISGRHPLGMRERNQGVGEGITENHRALAP
jgi:hypothetical protein